MRVRLIISYEGTHYSGFQSQPSGNTVQDRLECALSQYFGGDVVKIHGAGRTDAGVHALAQNIHFDTDKDVNAYRLCLGLNTYLPMDIAVQEAYIVDDDWDARFDAISKTYRYALYCSATRRPLLDGQHGWIYRPLDRQAVESTARLLVGEHDFGAFQNSGSDLHGTIRTVHSLDVQWCDDDVVYFTITGNAFLYNMVRNIVGCLVEVGSGKRTQQDIANMLSSAVPSTRMLTMPPQGLTLVSIGYGQR